MDEREADRAAGIDRIIDPLKANMARAGGFDFESIQRLGNPVPLLVQNDGEENLRLWLEPSGQDYWLGPGEAVYVTSYGTWNDHPFETIHESDCLTVWATSWFATVSDRDGNEFPPGPRDTVQVVGVEPGCGFSSGDTTPRAIPRWWLPR